MDGWVHTSSVGNNELTGLKSGREASADSFSLLAATWLGKSRYSRGRYLCTRMQIKTNTTVLSTEVFIFNCLCHHSCLFLIFV